MLRWFPRFQVATTCFSCSPPDVRVKSSVPQGSVLGPLLFLAYVNDVWRNMESTIRIFADDCVIYRKIINNADMENFQKGLDRLGE